MSGKNDIKIKELIEKVEAQRKDLGTRPKNVLKTNGIFKYSDGTHFNINMASEDTLVAAIVFLLERKSKLEEASKILEIATPKFEWNSYSFEDYVEDFKYRISLLTWEHKKRLLDATSTKLSGLISEEAKTELELDNIEKLLK